MGRDLSTLYRELNRNGCQVTGNAYRPSKAEQLTRVRRCHSQRNRRFRLLKRSISYETIYRYIGDDKRNGGCLWQHLRQSSKKRRKRYNTRDNRGLLAEKTHI